MWEGKTLSQRAALHRRAQLAFSCDASVARAASEHYGNLTVETMHVPDNYGTKINALFAAGTPPDSGLFDMAAGQGMIAGGMLLDLTPSINRDRARFKPDDVDQRFFLPMKDAAGKSYGVPYTQSVNAIFFNENLFRAAGEPTPMELFRADKWTWEAFLKGAQRTTIRDATGDLQHLGIRSAPAVGGQGEQGPGGGLEAGQLHRRARGPAAPRAPRRVYADAQVPVCGGRQGNGDAAVAALHGVPEVRQPPTHGAQGGRHLPHTERRTGPDVEWQGGGPHGRVARCREGERHSQGESAAPVG